MQTNGQDQQEFPSTSSGCDIVVIGASAGGVEALTRLLGALPEDLRACVLIVLHVAPTGESVLAKILDRASPLHCAPAADGELLHHRRAYVAPSNCHLLVEPGRVRVTSGPRENGFRPAVDPLFRTAADTYRERVAGVILTGTRDDGTAGLAHVKRRGGLALVQDPAEAAYPSMPRSALEAVPVDAMLGLDALAAALPDIVARRELPDTPETHADQMLSPVETASVPTRIVCPACGGTLTEEHEHGVPTYVCHIGHRYAPRSLIAEHADAVEQALWTAARSLEERGILLRRMATMSDEAGRLRSSVEFSKRADEADGHVRVLRETLGAGDALEHAWPDDDLT